MKNRLLFKYYQFLGYYARKYIKKWQPLVIGINGSVGKTSCRMIVDEVLQAHLGEQLTIYTSPKNFNGELGMSLSIFKITERIPSLTGMITTLKKIITLTKSDIKPYDVIILEYGIDRPHEMEFLCSIVKPHISILTKIDAVHSLQFGTTKDIAKEELKLQKNTILHCYMNTNDIYGMQLAPKLKTKITYYHTDNETWNKNDIYTTHYEINKNIDTNSSSPINSSSKLHYHQEEISFTTNILGKIHHDYVALAYDIVETIRNQYNLPKPIMKKNISLQLQPGRMSLFHGLYNSIIIDSTYNSSPLSLKKVIEESNNLHKELYPDYIRIYILGDMRELGESENQHHTELADYLGSFITQKDYIIFLGQAIQTTYDKIQKSFNSNNKRGKIKNQSIYHYLHYSEVSKKVTELVKELSQKNKKSFILAKGSQNTIFLEEVVKSLLVNMKDSKYLTRQSDRWLTKK